MIHGSHAKKWVVASVRNNGHNGNLAKGQVTIVKDRGNKGKGLQVVDDFTIMNLNDKIQINSGEVTTPGNLRIKEVPHKSTGWFQIKDVIEVTSHVPSQTKLVTDRLEIGYDGINQDYALYIPEGKSAVMDLTVHGAVASMFFGQESYTITREVFRPKGASMQKVITAFVKSLNEENTPTSTGYESQTQKLSDYLTIGVIDSSNTALVGEDYTLFSLNVPSCEGGSNELAVVQSQMADYSVQVLNNDNGVVTYGVLAPAATVLPAIEVENVETLYDTCDVCPTGYVAAPLTGYCTKTTTATYNWVAGDICKASKVQYNITLPDTECGASRLTELQLAYPDLVIEEGAATGTAATPVTLTGTAGDATITIGGVAYTTPFTTDIPTTAADFVTAHKEAILAATGLVVTSEANVVTLAGNLATVPAIVGSTVGITTSVGAVDLVTVAQAGGCKRTYSTSVMTNIVCEECSPIYLQPFYGEAPEDFEFTSWSPLLANCDANALMGIYVEGKPFYIYPLAHEEYFVPYMETSLKIKGISFGASGSLTINYNGEPYNPELEFAEGRRIRYAEDVNNDAEALFASEDVGNTHYTNKSPNKKNLFARVNLSQERILKYHKKYVQYAVKWKDNNLSQGGASRSDITHEIGFIVQYGNHLSLEAMLNGLATKAGLPTVSIP